VTWYPGWDSLDSVRTWHTVFEISGIAFLALLVGAEILAFQYGHRKDELTAIAESNAETKRKSDADAAEVRRKADVEALQKRLAEADKKVAGLQSQNVGRRLSADQKAAMVLALSPFKGQKVFIWCSTAAWDCTPFATDFLETFKQAGWQPTDEIRFGIVTGGDAVGVEILVNPQMANAAGQVSMPSVITLIETLVRLNLMPAASLGRMPEIEAGTIYFRIGRIPPPK
jgi:hypothetical protein